MGKLLLKLKKLINGPHGTYIVVAFCVVFSIFQNFFDFGGGNSSKSDVKKTETSKKVELKQNTAENENQKLDYISKKLSSGIISKTFLNSNIKVKHNGSKNVTLNGLFSNGSVSTDRFVCYYDGIASSKGMVLSLVTSFSVETGNVSGSKYLCITGPYVNVKTLSSEVLNWDTIVFGDRDNSSVMYVFTVNSRDKEIAQSSRDTVSESVFLGDKDELCFRGLTGKNPYIAFKRGKNVVAEFLLKGNALLDDVDNVLVMIPAFKDLKNDKGRAYLYLD